MHCSGRSSNIQNVSMRIMVTICSTKILLNLTICTVQGHAAHVKTMRGNLHGAGMCTTRTRQLMQIEVIMRTTFIRNEITIMGMNLKGCT
jgi:hypothetical protein